MSLSQAARIDFAGGEPPPQNIAFFHQNDPFARQGGIERYVATLLNRAEGRAVLVSAPLRQPRADHFAALPAGPAHAPQWLRFILGLIAQRRAIRAFLRERRIGVLEFSRPEYVLAGWLFPGVKAVTIHGTGPDASQRLHFLLHHLCCLLLPFCADRVQVVGRDRSGLPRLAQRLLGRRVALIDAWHDDRFAPTPLPALAPNAPLRVFYAGRIAPQKDPALLFAIVRQAAADDPKLFEFRYFGSDYDAFVEAGLGDLVHDGGFLGVDALAKAIGDAHVGLLCSAFGEGSPFIVVEAMACGRPFVLAPLPTLNEAYGGLTGAHVLERRDAAAFVAALKDIRAQMLAARVDPFAIAASVAGRAQSRAAPLLLADLARLAANRPRATRASQC